MIREPQLLWRPGWLVCNMKTSTSQDPQVVWRNSIDWKEWMQKSLLFLRTTDFLMCWDFKHGPKYHKCRYPMLCNYLTWILSSKTALNLPGIMWLSYSELLQKIGRVLKRKKADNALLVIHMHPANGVSHWGTCISEPLTDANKQKQLLF